VSRPKLIDYREVLEARETYVNVQLRLNALEKQASDINQQIINNKENTDHAVNKYLAGENYEHRDMVQQRFDSLEKIHSEKRIALKALKKAKRAVYEVEVRVSKDICEKIRPEYEEIPKRLSKALIIIQEISDEEMGIRGILGKDGIEIAAFIPSCCFRPALGNDIKNAEFGHFSIIGHWHRAQIQNGYLKPGDIPRHWREIWALDSVQMDGQSKGNGEVPPETTVKQNEDGWLNIN